MGGACPQRPPPRRGSRVLPPQPSIRRANSRERGLPVGREWTWIPGALLHRPFCGNPVGLGGLDLGYQFDVFGLWQSFPQVLFVFGGGEQLAFDSVGLAGELANVAVEFQVRHVEGRLASGDMLVDLLDQLLALEMEQEAAMLVHALEICFLLGLRLIVAALQAPNVEPVRRARAVHAKQVVAHRHPLVDELLDDGERHHTRADNALDAVLARAQVERFLAQHRDHRLRHRGKSRVTQHGKLELAVAIDEIGVGEEVEPVVDVLVEGPEQTLLIKRPPLQHLLRLDAPAVAEMVDQQRSEEHTSELQSQSNLVCRLLLEKKKKKQTTKGQHSSCHMSTYRHTHNMDSMRAN